VAYYLNIEDEALFTKGKEEERMFLSLIFRNYGFRDP